MNRRNVFAKLSIAIALVAIASTVTIWEAWRVHAFNPQPDPPGFGIVSITTGQILRVNVVNTAVPDPNLPPDPCRVTLTFRNADGDLFRNADGNPIGRVVQLQAGKSVSFDLNADDFARMNGDRFQLRPVARVQQADPVNGAPPDPCIPTAEVINNANGRTQFSMSYSPVAQRAASTGQ